MSCASCICLSLNCTSDVAVFVFLEIREEERKILERAGYFQSITVGVAPIVVVIASVVTFSVHMILGYDLTAAQVSDPLITELGESYFIISLLE